MPLPVSGQVGEQILGSGVTTQPLRQGRLADVIVSELNGKYYELVRSGRVFLAANQAGLALSLLSATATGFILTNPAGSNFLVCPLTVDTHFTAVLAASAVIVVAANVNIAAAAVVHTTPLTVRNALLGGSPATGVALADSAATLPVAPVIVKSLLSGVGAAPTTATVSPPAIVDLAGQIVLYPGSAISIQGTAAVAGAIVSMSWAELPL